jgi:hypothetical protein
MPYSVPTATDIQSAMRINAEELAYAELLVPHRGPFLPHKPDPPQ